MHAGKLIDNNECWKMVTISRDESKSVDLTEGAQKKLIGHKSDVIELLSLMTFVKYLSKNPK
ncbi:MAG: hypothetical protein HeimC3_12340 [Candidatus Heimdallarchaeota archaeon LC_3]|nr:MAG: hypothetical protein HeimC3_12340 [Candidatus Heimdallarchaeota archaeon LC_3]